MLETVIQKIILVWIGWQISKQSVECIINRTWFELGVNIAAAAAIILLIVGLV